MVPFAVLRRTDLPESKVKEILQNLNVAATTRREDGEGRKSTDRDNGLYKA